MQQVGIKVTTSALLEAKKKVETMLGALSKIEKRAKNVAISSEKRLTNTIKKIETSVFVVANNVITNLYTNTHQGDIESLMAGALNQGTQAERNYYKLYEKRKDDLGLPIDVGYHAGSYRYSESVVVQFAPIINDISDMQSDLKSALESQYSLGDTFYVMGVGPALGLIESGQYGPSSGILKPTLDSVMRTYKMALSSAYNKI